MSNVIKFRRGKRIPFHRQKPRQRVFCLGCHYMGGDCCQSIQHVCRKRHKHDEWTFVDYSEATPVNFIGTTVSELMDRINEMHLEDPLSEHDLYNIDRKANIGFGPIPDIGWLAMTIDLPFLEGTEIGDVSQGQLGMLMLEKGNEGMCGIETMMPK